MLVVFNRSPMKFRYFYGKYIVNYSFRYFTNHGAAKDVFLLHRVGFFSVGVSAF